MAKEPQPATPQRRVYVGLPKRYSEMTDEERDEFAMLVAVTLKEGLGGPPET